MTEANAHRGEIEIDLGAAGTFVLRPDFEAVAAIDDTLGGIIGVAKRAFDSNGAGLTLHEMAVIVAKGMDGQARKEGRTAGNSVDKVKRMIHDAGMTGALQPCIEFIGNAISGGAKAETASAGNE